MDTLSAGYGVINRRPWIVLFPVLLDLFLWFGPQVSVAPLIGQALSWPSVQRGLGATDAEALQRAVMAAADELNLLALLSPGWVSVPSIMPLLGGGRGPFTFAGSWSAAGMVAVAALLTGVLLAAVYRTIIAAYVREGAVSAGDVPREAVRAWARLLGLGLILVVGGAALAVPAALVVAMASLVARELGSFGMALVMPVLVWLQLYLFFAPEAIFVSRVGPLQAMRRSVAVVRANFWATVRIGVLITIILLGMGQVWVAVASQAPWGTALGILGNAYIASGLVAASMVFYYERAAALPGPWPVRAAREV